jgi:glutathione peroxidase
MNIYDIEVTLENGERYTLDRYKGKTLLIVNTATKCGLASQFEDLQKLYEDYQHENLMVLGFPSNQFKQEVGDASEAAESCRSTYGVTFPMHEIIEVNGGKTHPLFKYLKDETTGIGGSAIKWNFTNFLVDKNGHVVTRFAPTTQPLSVVSEIEAYL